MKLFDVFAKISRCFAAERSEAEAWMEMQRRGNETKTEEKDGMRSEFWGRHKLKAL